MIVIMVLRVMILAFLVAAMSSLAYAQSAVTGAIAGTVTDPNRALVPGASVTVRSEETNNEARTVTDDQGRFQVSDLQPGDYLLSIKREGFAPYPRRVVVEVGDDGQTSSTFAGGNTPFNPFDLSVDQRTSSFDMPDKFTASVVWSPNPFGSKRRLARKLFDGFNLAPAFFAASGQPYSAIVGGSPAGAPSSGLTGGGSTLNRLPLFPRNSFRSPKLINLDMRISRRFHFSETKSLEVIAEGFNIFNRTQVTGLNTRMCIIGGTATASTLTFDPSFRTISTAGNNLIRERQIQLAVRFAF